LCHMRDSLLRGLRFKSLSSEIQHNTRELWCFWLFYQKFLRNAQKPSLACRSRS
jgi:hypothetical protein